MPDVSRSSFAPRSCGKVTRARSRAKNKKSGGNPGAPLPTQTTLERRTTTPASISFKTYCCPRSTQQRDDAQQIRSTKPAQDCRYAKNNA